MTTSPGTRIEGNITEIDHDNKYFVLQDREGKPHKLYWAPAHDAYMRKQKPGYYQAPIITGTGDQLQVIDIFYVQRPADFPRLNTPGKKPFRQPRDEKIIVYQTCYKESCETLRQLAPMYEQAEEQEITRIFNLLHDQALTRAKHDAAELILAAGGTGT